MMGRHSIELPHEGPGDHIPSPAFLGFGGRAASLTHKKKKKKKKKSGEKQRLDPTTTAKLVPTGKYSRVR